MGLQLSWNVEQANDWPAFRRAWKNWNSSVAGPKQAIKAIERLSR